MVIDKTVVLSRVTLCQSPWNWIRKVSSTIEPHLSLVECSVHYFRMACNLRLHRIVPKVCLAYEHCCVPRRLEKIGCPVEDVRRNRHTSTLQKGDGISVAIRYNIVLSIHVGENLKFDTVRLESCW